MNRAWYLARYHSVPLNEWQIRVCKATGERRQRHAEETQMESRFGGVEAHILGCQGECGVTVYLNVVWLMCIGNDRDGDIVLPDGRKADVKARMPRTDTKGPLTAKADAQLVYIFTQVDLPLVIFLGWIDGAVISKVSKWRDGPQYKYPCWDVPLIQLRPIAELL